MQTQAENGERDNAAADLPSQTDAPQPSAATHAPLLETWPDLLDALTCGVLVIDEGERVSSANRMAQQILGVTAETLLGRPLTECWSGLLQTDGTDMPGDQCPPLRALHSGQSQQRRVVGVILHDMQSRWLQMDAVPLPVRAMSNRRVVVTFTDITSQQRSHNDVWNMVAALSGGVVVMDRAGNILQANAAADQIFGVRLSRMRGQRLPRVLMEANVSLGQPGGTSVPLEEMPGMVALRTGQPDRQMTLSLIRPGGQQRWIQVDAVPVRDGAGDIEHVVINYVDLTSRVQAEQGIVEREKRFREAFSLSAAGMALMDLQGRFMRVNGALCRFLGFPQEELLSKTFLELIYPSDRQADIGKIRQLLDGQIQSHMAEQRYVHKHGHVIWGAICVAAARDANGEPLHFIVQVLDITARKRAEEDLERERQQLRQIVAIAPVAIAMLDTELRYLAYSAKWLADYQLAGRNLHGQSHLAIFPGTPQYRRILQQCAVDGVADGPRENIFLRDDGSKLHLRWAVAPWHTTRGEVGGLVIVTDCINEIIEAREAVLTAMREKAEALEESNRDLARSNGELEEFAYVASHDLQEPLRLIVSYTQLLSRRYAGKLDSDAAEFMGFVVDSATHMQKLIKDLLSYSRIGTHSREFLPVDMGEVLNRVVANLQTAISESQAKILYHALPTVYGDAGQLVQLFQNLIANAIKFRQDAPPEITIDAVLQEGEWLIAVRDNGIGIDPAYAERIFVIFQRLHTRSAYPGTGIGLAICKKIVERHGGRIRVESQAGNGATFLITLSATEDATT